MSQIQQINTSLEGVGAVLKSRRFKVPAYQRSYAWEIDHIDALLNDIHEAIKNKEREYFLGSMVLTSDADGRFEIVDGQQRLTTISLILAAIKEIFRSEEDHEVVISINSDYLASTDRRTKEREPKLVLNEVDNEIYQELIESFGFEYSKQIKRTSHKRLIEAANYCFEYLRSICKKSKDSEEELHSWLDYIDKCLKIIVVTAPDDSNAFVIFETLNDRGLELAISDLVKNYLFHRSGDKINEAKAKWLSMVSILESSSDDPLIVTYIRHFAMSRYGLVREKDLFGLLKSKITSKKNALKFSSDLADTMKLYSALINTEHEFWAKFSPEVKNYVSTLNLLGMTQIRPLLISVLNNFDAKNVTITLKKLVSAAVRYQMVGGVGGGTLEKLYSETAKSISDGKITGVSGVISAFTTLPSDAAFKTAFSIATVSKQKIARYYLRELEIASGGGTHESIPDTNTNQINLEHILPLNPVSDWTKYFMTDELRSYQNRLGNMALMLSKLNSSTGNDDFKSKRKHYRSSELNLTKSVADYPDWTKESIEKRQLEMAELAVKHWAI